MRISSLILIAALRNLSAQPHLQAVANPIRLSTLPHHVYKESNDQEGSLAAEKWTVYVLVNDAQGRALTPMSATIELFSGNRRVETVRLGAAALAAMRNISFKQTDPAQGVSARGAAAQEELFDLRHAFAQPPALRIDRMRYHLELKDANGKIISAELEIPLTVYIPKTKLRFPLLGDFVVVVGHLNDDGHNEWSQSYADDILATGPHAELLVKGDGSANEDYYGWGREVLAPAAGTVVRARNDVPNQPHPGTIDRSTFINLPEPTWAAVGNGVVIDHGNGEFSLLAHMQPGSVTVKAGDKVTAGQVIGKLGNSGNATGPHLHYHLMACAELFRCDGLPTRFENTDPPSPRRGKYASAK